MQSVAVRNGKNALIDLRLEFEGKRAFAIWESIPVGNYELKARVELDPELLLKTSQAECDFIYHGQLILPRPQDN